MATTASTPQGSRSTDLPFGSCWATVFYHRLSPLRHAALIDSTIHATHDTVLKRMGLRCVP